MKQNPNLIHGKLPKSTPKRISKLKAIFLFLLAIASLPAWYRHLVVYPRYEKQRAALRAQWQPPKVDNGLRDFKGSLHNHCYWSHDSRGNLHEILSAARRAGLHFVFFNDHPRSEVESFPRALHGSYGNILLIPGSENKELLVWPRDSATVDWRGSVEQVIARAREDGALVFYAHTERPHSWGNSLYHGMEIYNMHADAKDENYLVMLPEVLVNSRQFPFWVFRSFYDDLGLIALWDSLNVSRKIVGIAANDAHDNLNIRGRYLEDGRVEWLGPSAKTWGIVNDSWLQRFLLDEPDSSGWSFRWELSNYYETFSYVSTHLLADTLNREALYDALRRGHAYVAFDGLAPAQGFVFRVENEAGAPIATMGDTATTMSTAYVRVELPIPARIHLLQSGRVVARIEESRALRLELDPAKSRGAMRVEAFLRLGEKWLPWIFSNPIYVTR